MNDVIEELLSRETNPDAQRDVENQLESQGVMRTMTAQEARLVG